MKKLLQSISTHNVGDTLTDATPAQLLAQVESIDANGNDKMQKTATEKFVNSLMILVTLEDNELLKVEREKPEYTLTGVK